ncbi:MAG: squalene--hopene cyclase [Acidobacteriota bacterium]|nr:squalene--hopene cyclase [Acidobacteriota bacterium]
MAHEATKTAFQRPTAAPTGEELTSPKNALKRRLRASIDSAAQHLLSLQQEPGYWVGELEADTTLESDYIFFLDIIGKASPARIARLASTIRREQLPDGGWNIYAGGPSELNATVKAYFALKLAGDSPGAAHMAAACRRAIDLGGLEQTNSYTRFYFALCGKIGWDKVPAMPPELMLLPRWFFVNVYRMSSWTRGILVPLTVLFARKPAWRLPAGAGVDELWKDPKRAVPAFRWDSQVFSWRNFFQLVDRLLKLYEALPWKPLRAIAYRRACEWLLEHLERSEGMGAIFPAMLNATLALVAMGYPPDHPLTARERRYLAQFEIEGNDAIHLQPCLSPVWDTALAVVALQEAGVPSEHPGLSRAVDWLIEEQILGPGDWQLKNPAAAPAGWAFEFRNDFYPDVDDTAFVLLALQSASLPGNSRLAGSIESGLKWVLSMQNRDGGWGAFDRDNDLTLLTRVPFADHNAMIDPSTPDLAARAVECLGRSGLGPSHPAVRRAVEYLRREQTEEGAWYGRWGVNYVYGTSGVLRALETVGLQHGELALRGAAWLRSVQNEDGGFGESIASYDNPALKGMGESTASQTAWGLIGLLAAGSPRDPSALRAVNYLLDRQNAQGSWDEDLWTGTGFPRVFYLKYHLYRISFPLYALARFLNQAQ